MRTRVRKLFKEYNDTTEDDMERRQVLLHEMFGSHGTFIYCEPPVRFDYGKNTHVGDCFFSNFNLVVLDCAPVNIGKQCFIGPNVSIVTPVHPLLACDRNMRPAPDGTKFDYEYAKPITIGDDVLFGPRVGLYAAAHPIDAGVRREGLEYGAPIVIGNGVWLGGNVVVNPGVKIGDGAVIGSGSVVTRDIPANVVAAGVPCRVLREIGDADRDYWRALRDEYRAWEAGR